LRASAKIVLILLLALTCGQSPAHAAHPEYSADGLYNLGNAYARAGKPGLAVLNYERALLLAPGDADIHANLDYVRASVHLPPEQRTLIARITQAINPTAAAWIGAVGVALIGAGLLAGRFWPRHRWKWNGVSLVGLTLLTLTAANAIVMWPRMSEAVILVNQAAGRVSPVPMGDTAFTLQEAETVSITAEHEDFMLIRTRSGLSGWVARADIGAVIPDTDRGMQQ
jgi:hypothetical protein